MFAIFRKRDFSLMWSAQLVSTIGEALTDLAAAIIIFRITDSAFAVGAVLMVTAIPTLIFGLFAGVFVDRFDKKRILLLANLLRGFIVLGIPLAYTVLPESSFVLALYIDALTYFVAFALLLPVRVPKGAAQEATSVAVVVENLKSGAQYLWR